MWDGGFQSSTGQATADDCDEPTADPNSPEVEIRDTVRLAGDARRLFVLLPVAQVQHHVSRRVPA